jgi:hypothetical protein
MWGRGRGRERGRGKRGERGGEKGGEREMGKVSWVGCVWLGQL